MTYLFKFNNIKYNSIKEFASKYSISQTVAVNLLVSHATFDTNAINQILQTGSSQNKIFIDNVEYVSLESAANVHDMSRSQLKYNLSIFGYKTNIVFDKKISSNDFGHFRLNSRSCPLIVANIKFKSLDDICKYARIPQSRLLKNIRTYGTKSMHVFDMHNSDSKHKIIFNNLVFSSKGQMMGLLDLHHIPSNTKSESDLAKFIDSDKFVNVNRIYLNLPGYVQKDFKNLVRSQTTIFTKRGTLIKLKAVLQFYYDYDFLK
ncbi:MULTISPECIES: hypothetical protein [Lactobacillus]|uniref:hypothetical protein n=1 Tax=Lactobacillus TaxID=1578 RepID=UPI0011B3CE2D|nr:MULTISPECIES: hypothetical protein [Lactobacillus]MRM99581.1 hypothetical protein [Lactobacillus taiwanensis]TWU79295.1 hypothetical protein DLD91_01879 [Lactobacillus johnsonii]TWU79383.1 hypothetical protein DLD91_01968 [Lactobacillus johnsonii]